VGSDLQQNRYDQLIRRVGGIIGTGSKVAEALAELFPTIDVENVPGELLWLMGTHPCIGATTVIGAAGERPRIQVFNPVDSGTIIAVSSFYVSGNNNMVIRYASNNIPLTTGVGTQRFRDRRGVITTLPVGEIRTDSTVAITDADALFRILNTSFNRVTDTNGIAILTPGSGLEVGSETVASTIWVTFNWRERVAERSELLF